MKTEDALRVAKIMLGKSETRKEMKFLEECISALEFKMQMKDIVRQVRTEGKKRGDDLDS